MLADRPDCRNCNSEIAVCTAAAWSGWNQNRSIHRFGQRRQRLPNNKAGRSSLEAFIGREEVSEAVLKWFEDEGRAKELGTVKVLPGAAEHQRAFLIAHKGSSAIEG